MSSSMSSLQFPVLQLLFWFYDVPEQAAVMCLTKYYITFPRQAPSSDIKKKRDLAHLLTIFYILGIVCTLYYTYTTLPENYYEIFGASCDNLDVVQLKRLFRRASLIYHPDKNAGPEAVDNFVRVRNAYDTLINDKKREMYNRVGPSVVTGYKTATALDYVDASVKRMVVDHAMSLLFQFGFSFISPAMRITWWKCVLLSISVVIELNLISSAQSCGILVFGKPFLLHELLLLARNLYHSLNIAFSRIIPHFVNEPRSIPDSEVFQHNIVSQMIKSNAAQQYNATLQPFILEDGTLMPEMRAEITRLQALNAPPPPQASAPAPPPPQSQSQPQTHPNAIPATSG